MTRRAFTVDEANAALPRVRRVLEALHRQRVEASGHQDRLGILDALWGEAVERPENPDHDEYLAHRRALAGHGAELERLIREELVARGIRFPAGGLEHGLVDFPTTLDGRWVYLCWHRGEPEVGFWHELDGGFRGRREITARQRLRMGLPDDPARRDDSALDF